MTSFQERLEALDEINAHKSEYMALILDILHKNGTSKEDIDTIQWAIYSYDEAK